jgi:hypothetical protein
MHDDKPSSRQSAVSLLAVACLSGVTGMAQAKPLTLKVSVEDGNDAGSGPFATLERARDEIRDLKRTGNIPADGIVVELAGGEYELSQPFALTAEDSGTETAPIIYRAREGETVKLIGGKAITGFSHVTDPEVLRVLDEDARGWVYQADLKAHGITEYGSPEGGGIELFFDDQPMPLARWPNDGFVHIKDVVDEDPVNVRGTIGDRSGKFHYEGDRPTRWLQETDLWLHGYWFWDWADQRMKVGSVDLEQRLIALAGKQHGYGYRKGQWYYAFNALSEIDEPGEWYVDRDQGILYLWPRRPLEEGRVVVSVIQQIVTMNQVSHVTIHGLLMEACRNTAVVIEGGTQVRVVACTIRNTGNEAVDISGATNSGVVGCDISDTAFGCVSLTSGDRKTLTPAGLYADNNHMHDYGRWKRMMSVGVRITGVGNRATHNLIHHAPHMAIFFSGNDHLIEMNEIHNVSQESNDAGAIYAGRNWTMRGTVIRHNYLHHINGFRGRGCVGVYLDDMFCGTEISGNLFYKVTRAAFLGGGRDNRIENNIFVDCNPSTHIDSRAMGWAGYHSDVWVEEARTKRTHLGLEFMEPPYSTRWPQLTRILEEDPWAPRDNLVARNISVGGKWDDWDGKPRPLVIAKDNLVDEDPHFMDPERLDFRLRPDSPAFELGFKAIPVDQIGLYEADNRASWPVYHPTSPLPEPEHEVVRTRTLVFEVPRRTAPIVIDGVLEREEWFSANPEKTMIIQEGISMERASPRSFAWLAYDGEALYVAVDNAVSPSMPLSTTNTWGPDDAVEIAVRNPGAGVKAPILVLRGYPNGFWESSYESGASEKAVKQASRGVQFKTGVPAPGQWVAEWRIPWTSLGVDPRKDRRLQFNLSARKAAEPVWVEWQGTRSATWDVAGVGIIELAD